MTSTSTAQLDDVWKWYLLCRDAFIAAGRLVERYPAALPGDSELFSETVPAAVSRLGDAQAELDDLVILALFAVFERETISALQGVRDSAMSSLRRHAERELVSMALSDVEEWRLVELLDVFKGVVDSDTVGLVKQIKKNRDWVAHGKKGERPLNLDPEEVRERLRRFLEELNAALTETDRVDNDGPDDA
ncbi:MAG: hypothetical protein ACYTKD_22660 [Planctomycetota bacterium]